MIFGSGFPYNWVNSPLLIKIQLSSSVKKTTCLFLLLGVTSSSVDKCEQIMIVQELN
jgi:hypothetical protein